MGMRFNGGAVKINEDVTITQPVEVEISHTNDSIRIGDGTNLIGSTEKEGKFGLDVFPLASADTPEIINKSIPLADTEVSQVLPTDTRMFHVKIRNGASSLRIAFGAGETATKYFEIHRGTAYLSPFIEGGGLTLYLRSDKASVVAEIIAWKCV